MKVMVSLRAFVVAIKNSEAVCLRCGHVRRTWLAACSCSTCTSPAVGKLMAKEDIPF